MRQKERGTVNLRSIRSALVVAAVLAGIGAAAGLTAAAPAAGTGHDASVAPQQTMTCSWKKFGQASRGHYHLASAMDNVTNTMYFYGGIGQSDSVENDVMKIDFKGASINDAVHGSVGGTAGAKDLYGSVAAYRDKDGGQVYFIGGALSSGRGQDFVQRYNVASGTWESNISVNGQFNDRVFAAGAYDPKHDAIVVNGGAATCLAVGFDPDTDTCNAATFTGSTVMTFDAGSPMWDRLSGGPNRLFGHTMVYDSKAQRMLVYGGTDNRDRGKSGVQALDLSGDNLSDATWSTLATSGTGPSDRYFHSAAYDPTNNWMVIYGGLRSGAFEDESGLDDTWALDLNQSPAVWMNLDADQSSSTVGSAMGYDAKDNLVILHGGRRESSNNVTGNSYYLDCQVVTPTSIPPTVTPRPTNTPGGGGGTAEPTPPLTPNPDTCDFISNGRVPNAAINAATANPDTVYGWEQLCFPNRPAGPFNQLRDKLSLRNPAAPYHPIYNGLVWKCGCP